MLSVFSRVAGGVALSALALAVASRPAQAQVAPVNVADYQDDFQVAPGGANGWSFLWNANGPLGNPANYVPLVVDNGRYETVANGAYPDPAPGSSLLVTSGPADPLRYPELPGLPPLPPLPQTFVRPGEGRSQNASGGIERAVVLAYTFSAADFAAAGVPAGTRANAFITAYDFAVPVGSPDSVSARVYQDDNPAPLLDFSLDNPPPFTSPFRFETTLDPRPRAVGTYSVGDTLYVAVGPHFNDTGDELRLDFTLGLTPVPEPTSLAALAPLAFGLLMRRRRR